MYETQHLSQVIRHEEWWIPGSYWPTLKEAVAAMRRRLDPWDGRLRDRDEYRIVERNARGKIVAIYDTFGELVIAGLALDPKPKRLPVAA